MNTKDTLDLIGNFSSKIFHDVIAPMSAIDMGFSLLDEFLPYAVKQDPAYALLKDSLNKTFQRINFFRYAFSFQKVGSPPNQKDFETYCTFACSNPNIRVHLTQFELPDEHKDLFLRMAAITLYVVTDTLPKGGIIQLSLEPNFVHFDLAGPLVLNSPFLEESNISNLNARSVLSEFIFMGLGQIGFKLTSEHTPTSLKVWLQRTAK